MTALPCFVHRGVLRFVVLLLTLGTAAARDLDLTGDYDDEGTVVVAAPDPRPGVISLHALLSLEFIPGRVQSLHEETGLVKITHAPGRLEVVVLNRDEAVSWQATWKEGDNFRREGDALVLHLRPGRKGLEEFELRLETVSSYRLLQVELVRLTPSLVGPLKHPMGTYLFHRDE